MSDIELFKEKEEQENTTVTPVESSLTDTSDLVNNVREVPPVPETLNSPELAEEESKIEKAIESMAPPPLPPKMHPVDSSKMTPPPSLPPRNSSPQSSTELAPPVLPPRHVAAPSAQNQGIRIFTSPEAAKSMIIYQQEQIVKILKDETKYKAQNSSAIIPDEITEEWGKLISAPYETIHQYSVDIETLLVAHVPEDIRANVWDSLSFNYCHNWEIVYSSLLENDFISDDTLLYDLQNSDYVPADLLESIFNVIKGAILLNDDIKYNESLIFIATCIYHVVKDEVRAFGLLSTLLKFYDAKQLYLENSPGLSMLLFQFDRLLEENSPQIYSFLVKRGIRSSMYMSNYFLTFFSSILPIESSSNVMDLVFFEGLGSLLKIALTLMIKNKDKIISLEFDDLLFFLRNNLFDVYLNEGTTREENNESDDDNASVMHKNAVVSITADNLDIKKLIEDALNESSITPEELAKYESEYNEIHLNELAQQEQISQLEESNMKLQKQVRELEIKHTILSREHVTIANELLQNRLKMESVVKENTNMKLEVLGMEKEINTQIKKNKEIQRRSVPVELSKDLEKTLKKNATVMQQNLILQDRVTDLERVIEEIRRATEAGELYQPANAASDKLSKTPVIGGSWNGFKKVFS
ncbi:hypothetical protein KAFR_0A07210 [Kazachstania africana CBS 2517]|uniref:Rab-GAP TBC domain-containing protein n=1 Tax=Kazachstania africana (strain ATCC 22294 / BCRC 22015 / CBS 2517 / CECT 1963 / NBRC 1671 / NRRL Y-8276) TaxID=1071382 RepID=H2AP55_KAZAF|nr:hypothetical protein KAFR_0A07210 [Kazachstania africana CBS 2517]CCF56155.1 hypothetical protein KAFR_0A07210 [Kazachstania africana CBS 2517]